MLSNFSAKLVALIAALELADSTSAYLPHECFYVTDLHGPSVHLDDGDAELLSNLPQLMTSFKPGMRMTSIAAIRDDFDESVSVLQITLAGPVGEYLQLEEIGVVPSEWSYEKLEFGSDAPDRISILTDDVFGGVCDVVIYQGHTWTSMSGDPSNCMVEEVGISETMIRLTEEAPLVGFHATVDGVGIVSLGLIMLDTMDEICKVGQEEATFDFLPEMDEFDKSLAAESAITSEEHARAQALEAILIYDSMVKARESKEDILKQIQDLHSQEPINLVNDKPATLYDLKDLLQRLGSYATQKKMATYEDLEKMFDELANFYEGREDIVIYQTTIPLSLKSIMQVYNELNLDDGVQGTAFDGRQFTEQATLADLDMMIDRLADHFWTSQKSITDLSDTVRDNLVQIFDTMAQYYAFQEGTSDPNSQELWVIYDSLSEMLSISDEGKISDFAMDDDQIAELYELIKSGQSMEQIFEGQLVNSFEDLVAMEHKNKGDQLSALLNEVFKFEKIETESKEHFDKQNYEMAAQIQQMYNELEGEAHRLQALERLIEEGDIFEVYKEKWSEDTPKTPQEESTNTVNLASQDSSDPAEEDEVTETQQDEVADKVDLALEKLMYALFGFVAVTIIVSLAIGALCFMCVTKQCKSGQKQRLAQAKAQGLHFRTDTQFEPTATGTQEAINMRDNPTSAIDHSRPSPSEEVNTAQKALQNFDTEDLRAEEEEGKDKIQTTEDDEDNFSNMISSRGLNFKMPDARRATYQRGINPNRAKRNALGNTPSKKMDLE